MNMPAELATSPSAFAERYLRNCVHSWSIGVSGAIGEFMYDHDEVVEIGATDSGLYARTARGAIRFHLDTIETEVIAYRQRGTCTDSFSQAVAFCVGKTDAVLPTNTVLTELGPDQQPVAADTGYLFDLGLGAEEIRFCVRVAEPELLQDLRAACGKSLFAADNGAMAKIMAVSPPRVIESCLGRVEIYGAIPGRGTELPLGPHTHLLPRLLGKPPAVEAIPAHLTAALTLYPQHPHFDKYGRLTDYDQAADSAFEALLEQLNHENLLTT